MLAQQLGYADRDHYVADPDAVTVPVADLLNPAYIKSRARPASSRATPRCRAIRARCCTTRPWSTCGAATPTPPSPARRTCRSSTTKATPSPSPPRSKARSAPQRWTNGFLLNNQLTDFTRPPQLNGKAVANAPGPGKRPRSSMSPTIVFDKTGDVFMVTGSPGGNSIVGYVAKTLVAVLDWGKTAQEACALPNIVARGPSCASRRPSDAGANPTGKAWSTALTTAGFKIQEVVWRSLRPQSHRRAQGPVLKAAPILAAKASPSRS